MSSIEIRKYEYDATRSKNYFASPTFIDKIVLTSVLFEGFPIFNEEFVNQFNSFEYKTSDYDLVFSRMEETLTTNGDTLETFLSTDLDNHCLLCKVTIDNKTFGGLIDVNSIKFIDDLTSDGYKIQITVFGLAKEFSEWAQGKPPHPQGNTLKFNDYILGNTSTIWRGVDDEVLPIYMRLDSNHLKWVTRIGYEPELIRELWAFMIDNDRTIDCSTWKLFEDLCTAFGLIYEFYFTDDYGNYFQIVLRVAFRDEGFSSDTIEVEWRNRERGFISDINANVIQCFKFMKEEPLSTGTFPENPEETHFYGIVFNKDLATTADGDVYSIGGGFGEESLYSNGEGITINKLNNPLPFDVSDKVNFVEMNYYFASRYGIPGAWRYYVLGQDANGWYLNPQIRHPKWISFPRMWTKAGYTISAFGFGPHAPTLISHPENIHELWYDLIQNTCGVCYPYLLSTFRKYTSGDISLMDSMDVNVFDKIEVNSETYTIYKLSNLDFNKREVELYAIQD